MHLNAVLYCSRLRRRRWCRCFDHSHLTIDIMPFDATEALDHTATSFDVDSGIRLIILLDKRKLF